MNPILTSEHFQVKKNIPDLRAGDRVRVHQKIKEGAKERIQVFEGLIIKTQHGQGIGGTFTVRRISLGVGSEKTFPLHLPTIVKIEKIRSAKVRRAKLFYVRDLIGKRAKRLKREKDDKAVWEDVVVEKVEKDPELEQIEKEAEEAEQSSEKTEAEGKNDNEDVKEEKSDTEKPEVEASKEKAEEKPDEKK